MTPTSAITPGRFHLLLTEHAASYDLMAECGFCGAITEEPLAPAWGFRSVVCGNCGVVMKFDAAVLARLREQAMAVLATLDRLCDADD